MKSMEKEEIRKKKREQREGKRREESERRRRKDEEGEGEEGKRESNHNIIKSKHCLSPHVSPKQHLNHSNQTTQGQRMGHSHGPCDSPHFLSQYPLRAPTFGKAPYLLVSPDSPVPQGPGICTPAC